MELNWNREQKIIARQETIVKPYQSIFDKQCLSVDKQYWTLCGNCVSEGKIVSGTEPAHLIQYEFIKPSQFHGIEINEDTYRNNASCKELNFYHGNIVSILKEQHHNNPNFTPGIVNADFLRSPQTEAFKFLEILSLLKSYDQIMVIGNFCTKYYGKDEGPDSIIESMNKHELSTTVSKHWNLHDSVYKYVSSKMEMTSVIFYRK